MAAGWRLTGSLTGTGRCVAWRVALAGVGLALDASVGRGWPLCTGAVALHRVRLAVAAGCDGGHWLAWAAGRRVLPAVVSLLLAVTGCCRWRGVALAVGVGVWQLPLGWDGALAAGGGGGRLLAWTGGCLLAPALAAGGCWRSLWCAAMRPCWWRMSVGVGGGMTLVTVFAVTLLLLSLACGGLLALR